MVTRRDIIGWIAGIIAARQMPAMPIGARTVAHSLKNGGFDPARVFATVGSATGTEAARVVRVFADAGTVVDWGDGTTTVFPSGNNYINHTLPEGGPYTVEAVGGATTVFGFHAGDGCDVTRINVGDSVVTVGNGTSIGLAAGGGSPEEIAGMRNVETFSGPLHLPSLRRFAVPPKVEDLAVCKMDLPALETFSLGNVRRLVAVNVSSTYPRWNLGRVKSVSFAGVTSSGTRYAAPLLSGSPGLESVDWGSLSVLPGGSQEAQRGPFYDCPNLKDVSCDAGAKFSTPSDYHSYYAFAYCTSLRSRPLDISDAGSVSSSAGRRFFYAYYGCPQLFPDRKAVVDVRAFDTSCAAYCGIEDLTISGGDGEPVSNTWFSLTVGNGYSDVRRLTVDNVYSTSTALAIDGAVLGSIREIVFPRHVTYTASRIYLSFADEFANPVVVRYPENTIAEVKSLPVYGSTAAQFPFGCPAEVAADRLYFACKDGDMDAAGNAIP